MLPSEAMRLYVGTSGFGYDEWEGSLYPPTLPADDRLGFYAERFATVEINNTFYRMPKREVLQRWAEAVPPGFRFAIKVSRRITHQGRLHDADGGLAYLLGQLETLGDALGPLLFQTPPFLPKRADRLRELLAKLPAGTRAAFELRHASWDDPEVHQALRHAGQALCMGEHDEARGDRPLVRTAPWGYLRLHAATYDDAQLHAWAERIVGAFDEAYLFFKHEQSGPELARRMIAIATELGATCPGS